ncbi:unnamed protein product [Enterobius vermicularis]|uniref:LRRCT domain-containing protein n=1 Tax=Enterobius vermicularis TaxID=51028 RepID=A0A0N4VM55_ENTVE|nr:unnamed protein product [Enterobius vermicularis]
MSSLRELSISSEKCLKLKAGSFAGVTQIDFFNLRGVRLENNQILLIDVDAFHGLDTVERLVLTNNKIGNISSHAFTSTVNIGDLIIEENQIKYLNPGSLQSTAWRTKFRDNHIECNCANQWIRYIKDIFLLKHNFCGAEEGFRTLMNYTPNCQLKTQKSASDTVSALSKVYLSFVYMMLFLYLISV